MLQNETKDMLQTLSVHLSQAPKALDFYCYTNIEWNHWTFFKAWYKKQIWSDQVQIFIFTHYGMVCTVASQEVSRKKEVPS